MSWTTPKFWRKKSLISLIILPLSLVYWAVSVVPRFFLKERQCGIKIICVGNLTAGGAGKTPTAIALGEILKKKKINFAYLSSGYGGNNSGFREVFKDSNPKEVGDESIILSEIAPAFVSSNRAEAIKELEGFGYDLVVLDDGMQDKRVKKDLLFVVIDGKIKFGNGLLIPAGPLRRTVCGGLKLANRIVVIGSVDQGLKSKIERCGSLHKLLNAKIDSPDIAKLKREKVLAFCGIGYPEKFFSLLIDNGVELIEKKVFADHYSYADSDLDSLIERSKKEKLFLLTTKKDWIKFPEKYRQKINFLDINFTFEQEDVIIRDIERIIAEK